MLFRQLRSYRLTNIFVNRRVLNDKKTKYRFDKDNNKNLYVIQKHKVKQKRKIF